MRYDPDQIASDVGKRVAELRREKGLTQVRVAESLNVAYQWISQIERGQNVSVHTLARLANALDVPMAQFFAPSAAAPKGRSRSRAAAEKAPRARRASS